MQPGALAQLKRSRQPMRDVFGEALLDLCRADPRVVVLDGDLSNSTKTELVRRELPQRFFNMGIAERNLVGVGAGLAACGFVPFIVSFSSFLLCNAYDQLRLAISMSKVNAKIVGSHGGITLGRDGPTQMGPEDLTLVGGLPSMAILVPCDPASMRRAVRAAADHVGPVFLRSSRVAMPHVYEEDTCEFQIGRANVVRPGRDLTIIACGVMVAIALDAAVLLAAEGIDARVMDLHTIRPLDRAAIEQAARETGAIITAEEHFLHGGVGANVARLVAETCPVPMRFVGLRDTYVESGEPMQLLQKYGLTAGAIAAAGLELRGARGRPKKVTRRTARRLGATG